MTTRAARGIQAPGQAETGRALMRRHSDRACPEELEAILEAGRVAHVGFVVDGQPYVLPLGYLYEEGCVYLHGAQTSRALRVLAAGAPVCVEVTLLDGLVASREALSHSMNYRSAVVFGRARVISETEEKRAVLERMTLRYFPGRTAGVDYDPAIAKHLRGTALLAVAVEEGNAKVRRGPPLGPRDAEPDAPGTAYVVALPGGHG